MELGVKERVVLLQLLPTEADYITYKIIEDLKMELSFSEDEIKEFEITVVQGQILWNTKKIKTKEIEIGETAEKIITKALEEADKQNKINGDNSKLYERFVLKNE